MSERILAEGAIEVGHHTTAHWLGMTVNTDTVLATAIAAAITLALAFFLRAKVTSTGVPSGVQLFWGHLHLRRSPAPLAPPRRRTPRHRHRRPRGQGRARPVPAQFRAAGSAGADAGHQCRRRAMSTPIRS